MSDLVAEAAELIDYDGYVWEPDGGMLPQSSAPRSILCIVRLLELEPGMRVLEVGTGSGYTGALLARLVGQQGSVISLDIDPRLVARAERKHSGYGLRNIGVHTTDGFAGWEAGGPYDRIVGWATPHTLPRRWVEQARDHTVIVTPIKVAPIAGANMILRADVHDRRPTARDVHLGGYIEMHSQVIADFPVPVRYVDGILRLKEHTVWVSAPALRGHPEPAGAAVRMIAVGRSVSSPVDRDSGAFGAACGHLLARRPQGLASAGVGGDWGIGLLLGDSAAFLRPDDIHVAGTHGAQDQLCALIAEWEHAGSPDHTRLQPHLTDQPDGFGVRVTQRLAQASGE
ncbi:MAG: protein-L-isoaspartate O-methyltransferase family protein [Pseudonocardiaceae bacterium]